MVGPDRDSPRNCAASSTIRVYLLDMSTRTGNLIDGFAQTYSFSNYTDAITSNQEQLVRSLLYAGSATLLAFLMKESPSR